MQKHSPSAPIVLAQKQYRFNALLLRAVSCFLILAGTYTAFGQSTYSIAPRTAGPASEPARPQPGGNQGNRELANLRSDFSILQEENQKLNMRMENLENELRARDAKIQELQNLLQILSNQVAANDKNAREQLEQLNQAVASEARARKSDMRGLAENVAKEISTSRPAPAPASPATGEYYPLTVEKGDTLSSIAKAAGVPWQELKRYNGLKSDIIRPGQVIKIPQK